MQPPIPRSGEAGTPTTPQTLSPGTLVDHFEIVRLLAEGAMGAVYLARDRKLGRKVALKMIRPELLGSRRPIERFISEARTTARFDHPNIVTIHAVGEHDGAPYVALGYVDGDTLRTRMQAGPLGLQPALRICAAIADALAHAHREGVLHRDLKPANVIIGRDGQVRVVDFGIAKTLDEAAGADAEGEAERPPPRSRPEPAGEGSSWSGGTPAYMAPEQWLGAPCGPAADVWALGVMLFELCDGRRPFASDDAEMFVWQVCNDEPVPRLHAQASVADLVDRCLQKRPEGRPSAARVAETLRAILEGQSQPAAVDRSPFRGLLPFDENDASMFFGRDAELAALLERAREQPVLPIVGASGAGKSSFVQAGLVPRLREQGSWRVIQLRPGRKPFHVLARRLRAEPRGDELEALTATLASAPGALGVELLALARAQRARVLLFVDQLEELFTLGCDKATATRFVESIAGAADDSADPVRVVFTLRHEFLDRMPASIGVRRALAGMTVLQRPDDDALREMLVAPLGRVGYRLEDESLADEVVAQVRGEIACLPLLQFAADTLWSDRDEEKKLLPRAAYERMGGVAGALARHADGVLEQLTIRDRALARELLLRLVTAERTRRVVSEERALAGLGEPEGEAARVLARLVDARLVTVTRAAEDDDEDAVLELAHESLVTAWSTLARWIEQSHDDLLHLEELERAAELWQRRGERLEELWQGTALRDALAAVARVTSTVPPAVQRFLEQARERERRRVRRRRGAVVASIVLSAAVTLVSVAVALHVSEKEREANEQRRIAEENEAQVQARRADALREAARGAFERGELLEARAKLRMAIEIEDTPAARVLWWQLQNTPLVWSKQVGAIVYGAVLSPDGRTVAAACQDGVVYVFDVATGAARILRGHRDQVWRTIYSPDGRLLASASWSGDIRLWDVASGRMIRRLVGHRDGINGLVFSPDGNRLASSSRDGTLRLWRVEDGSAEVMATGRPRSGSGALAISPDGRTLAVAGGDDGVVRLYDVVTGKPRVSSRLEDGHGYALAFSPDGQTLATSSASDAGVILWDARTLARRRKLRHSAPVWSIVFSGRTLAAGQADGLVRLTRVDTGEKVAILAGHRSAVSSVAFDRDGRFLVTSGSDRQIRLWSTESPRDWPPRRDGHEQAVTSLDFGKELLASGGFDGLVCLWDPRTGRLVREMEVGVQASGKVPVAFAPDANVLATSSRAFVEVVDLDSGATRSFGNRAAEELVFTPDGRLLAAAMGKEIVVFEVSSGKQAEQIVAGSRINALSIQGELLAAATSAGHVAVWHLKSGELRTSLGEGPEMRGAAFGGELLASGDTDGRVRLWDWARGTDRVLGTHTGRVYRLSFHPDGRLATPSSDGTVAIWNVADGQRRSLRGHRDEVNEVAFSPDGSLLASASDDGTVRLWDAASGRPYWRALFLPEPRLVFSHRGWTHLDGKATTAPQTRWAHDVEERGAEASGSELLCLRTHDERMALWDRHGDKLVAEHLLEGVEQVTAFAGGCAARSGRTVWLADGGGRLRTLAFETEVTALEVIGDQLAIATGPTIRLFGADGSAQRDLAAASGVTALTRATLPEGGQPALLLGYRDGNIEQLSFGDDELAAVSFAQVPASRPVRMLAGPAGTLVIGYANGVLGLWDLRDGSRLAHAKLHGAVTQLVLDGSRLHAISELGSRVVWNLEALFRDYCELMRDVWRAVPVAWDQGTAIRQDPDALHRCADVASRREMR